MVYGTLGLEQFAELRSQASSRLNPRRTPSPEADAVIGSDCFHNGAALLDEVRHWHDFLRRGVRKGDMLTEQVLNLVEEQMLVKNPEARITADNLYPELERLLKDAVEAQAKTLELYPVIFAALNRTEELWAERNRDAAVASKIHPQPKSKNLAPTSRGQMAVPSARKSHLMAPMQTSHRSKIAGAVAGNINIPSRVFVTADTDSAQSRVIVQSPPGAEPPPKSYETTSSPPSVPPSPPQVSPPARSATATTAVGRAPTGFNSRYGIYVWQTEQEIFLLNSAEVHAKEEGRRNLVETLHQERHRMLIFSTLINKRH